MLLLLLTPAPHGSAFTISLVVNSLIVLSTVTLCMETMPDYNPEKIADPQEREDMEFMWAVLETIITMTFTVDFGARCLGSIYARQFNAFRTDYMNVVDVIAIFPWWINFGFGLFGSSFDVDLRFVRVVRLVRVLRASERFADMGTVISDIFSQSAGALVVPLYFMMLALILLSAMMYFTEQCICTNCVPKTAILKACYPNADVCTPADAAYPNDVRKCKYLAPFKYSKDDKAFSGNTTSECTAQHSGDMITKSFFGAGGQCDMVPSMGGAMFESIPNTFWWCITTFSTVGYGDLFPITPPGQFLGFLCMFCGVFFISMPITIVGGAFQNSWGDIQHRRETELAAELLASGEWMADLVELRQQKQAVDEHILRVHQLIRDSATLAPEGSHWDDLDEKLGDLDETFAHAWNLYDLA